MTEDEAKLAYQALLANGHGAAKAAEIVLDAKRGDSFSLFWIDATRRIVNGQPVGERRPAEPHFFTGSRPYLP